MPSTIEAQKSAKSSRQQLCVKFLFTIISKPNNYYAAFSIRFIVYIQNNVIMFQDHDGAYRRAAAVERRARSMMNCPDMPKDTQQICPTYPSFSTIKIF